MIDYRIFALISFMLAFGMFLPFGAASHQLGSELVTNGDFTNERANNTFNFTFDVNGFIDSQPLANLDYIQDTVFGKSLNFQPSTSRIFTMKIPIQNLISNRLLNITLQQVGSGDEISVALGFNNNSVFGGVGNSVNIGNCDDVFCWSQDLGNGYTEYRINLSEEVFNTGAPEFSTEAIFLTGGNGYQLADNINLRENGVTTFSDDFEHNYPSGWTSVEIPNTVESFVGNNVFNITAGNQGDTFFNSAPTFILEEEKVYRFSFRYLPFNLSSQDLINDCATPSFNCGLLGLLLSGGGFELTFNNTTAIRDSGNLDTPNFQSITTVQDGQFLRVSADFTFPYPDDSSSSIGIAGCYDDCSLNGFAYFLIDDVSMKEILPDNAIRGNVTGVPATIVGIMALIILVGMIIVAYREIQGGRMDTDKLIKILVGIVITIGFVGAVLSFL